ncbi:hypothetical protein [Lactococcus cremoris]|uniref:Prophage protein n=1 Tax=Lactococcus lactis subsp. cremoris (strain MG1363) TaxID=416870 RepID=A2RMZ1_LACLM|nr:hypothetical protein [Lactococcus cremoris]ADJ61080.1 hypothetical protein LLNZ_10875 [Lactococcus cremoris subsp. cremoris NZ9000]MCT0476015.1 hypothetical protein [Lactococcus cremoris]MCT0509740.1 hypothetical protein [Lactococcus cremoris]MCT0511981.1 hypothetical protein [Lactococcus cremoris]MCT4436642.1 hypothetical protein [Lactococcus cremoris]
MSYVVDKSGDFSDYHEVHKGTCPNRPKVNDSYLIDGDFENDIEAMEYIRRTYPSLQIRPCSSCIDISSR